MDLTVTRRTGLGTDVALGRGLVRRRWPNCRRREHGGGDQESQKYEVRSTRVQEASRPCLRTSYFVLRTFVEHFDLSSSAFIEVRHPTLSPSRPAGALPLSHRSALTLAARGIRPSSRSSADPPADRARPGTTRAN